MTGGVQVPLITARCGYCDGLLAATMRTGRLSFECPACAPAMRTIATADEWVAFARSHRR